MARNAVERERAKPVFARQTGIVTVEAEKLAESRGVVRLIRDSGFRPRSSVTAGLTHGEFPITEADPARGT